MKQLLVADAKKVWRPPFRRVLVLSWEDENEQSTIRVGQIGRPMTCKLFENNTL